MPVLHYIFIQYDSEGEPVAHHRGGLCTSCRMPVDYILSAPDATGYVFGDDECGLCGKLTDDLEHWQIARVKTEKARGKARKRNLCKACRAPAEVIVGSMGKGRDDSDMRKVDSVLDLVLTRSIYVQMHGGEEPPPELRLE